MRKMFSVSAVLLLVSCIGHTDATPIGSYYTSGYGSRLCPIGTYQDRASDSNQIELNLNQFEFESNSNQIESNSNKTNNSIPLRKPSP